jgi:hypothetical protein
MKLSTLVEFVMNLILERSLQGEDPDRIVRAKLIWRDENNCVEIERTQYAEFGRCSPTDESITIEMNTAR